MWQNYRQQISLWKGVFVIAPSVAACVIVGSITGLLQLMEWATIDQFFRLRPAEPIDERIVIVTVDEPDIQYLAQWPMTDRAMAQILTNIKAQEPKAVGIDIYRDLVVEPGHETLVEVFKTTPNIIGIEKVAGNPVDPPPTLQELGQVGAADLMLDADGKVRRGLIIIGTPEGESRQGLGVKLALTYLEEKGIALEAIDSEKKIYGLGKAQFVPLTGKEVGYVTEDTGGYQILLNFRGGTDRFLTVSMTDVLENRIPPDLMRDRLVFIGAISDSLKDVFQTPYSSTIFTSDDATPGVVIHANIASQILSAAIEGRPMMQAWTKKLHWFWILTCSLTSAIVCCTLLPKNTVNKVVFFKVTLGSLLIEILIIVSLSYFAFLYGVLIPAFSPILAVTASKILTANYYNQWQLKLMNKKLQVANHKLNEYSKNLEDKVQQRTYEISKQNQEIIEIVKKLKSTQTQLIQAEKMSALGQLVAGIAHEINNPTNFIYGNISHAEDYCKDLLELIELYQKFYPNPAEEIEHLMEEIELEFLTKDFSKVIESMKMGASRIREIVKSLRTFSRLDEADIKDVDIHEGLESTLMILDNRLKQRRDREGIQVIKEYGKLPLINCYAGQLNQVFMNLIANSIDALESKPEKTDSTNHHTCPRWIKIATSVQDDSYIMISISDNGNGIPEEIQNRLFDPFFTTKPVGKGTGLGLSISYSIIVEQHRGELDVKSIPGEGTEFLIKMPIKLSKAIQPSLADSINHKLVS